MNIAAKGSSGRGANFVRSAGRSRVEIFKIHLIRRGVDIAGFDLGKLTQFTGGWAGAEIEQCVISALTKARLASRGGAGGAACQRSSEARHVRAKSGTRTRAGEHRPPHHIWALIWLAHPVSACP